MALKREEIQHIAELAKIELSEEELKKYGKQLSDILGYIDQLSKAKTKDIKPTAQVGDLKNIWRDDNVNDWTEEEVKDSLAQGELENGQIKVNKVL